MRSLPGFQPQLLASTMIDTPTAALSTAAPSDTSSAAASSEMFDAGSDSGTEESAKRRKIDKQYVQLDYNIKIS